MELLLKVKLVLKHFIQSLYYTFCFLALCKRLLNNFDWPLKPIDDSVKKIIWSFVVCLKDVEFYRLKTPRDPLIIFNRYDYIHSEFGSLYEPVCYIFYFYFYFKHFII
jgi:hypothetical protein